MYRANAIPGANSNFVELSPAAPVSPDASPTSARDDPSAGLTFWARRLAGSSELACARELAGLPEPSLQQLAGEFERFPRRQRTDPWRLLPWVGAALVSTGAIALIADYLMQGSAASGVSSIHLAAIVTGAVGVIVGCIGALASYGLVSLEMAYAKVGLYVSVLDTQHPWLYDTARLTSDEAAERYRVEVLDERGAIRGVDFVLMQEMARARAALEMTRAANHVVARVQRRAPHARG